MLMPSTNNTPGRTIVIMSNHVQQQQQQFNGDLSKAGYQAGVIRPNMVVGGNAGFTIQNGTPVMTTNQPSGAMRLIRTSSGLIELKNVRMPMGPRVIVAPAPGSQLPAQKSLSDPGSVTRTFNGVTLTNGIKRTFPGPGIRLISAAAAGSGSGVIAVHSNDQSPVTSPTVAAPTEASKLFPTSGAQINPALLKTLQAINQTKLVSGEREKLLNGASNRVQLQK